MTFNCALNCSLGFETRLVFGPNFAIWIVQYRSSWTTHWHKSVRGRTQDCKTHVIPILKVYYNENFMQFRWNNLSKKAYTNLSWWTREDNAVVNPIGPIKNTKHIRIPLKRWMHHKWILYFLVYIFRCVDLVISWRVAQGFPSL